jgi:uncharacterized delta-60 repeat protein
MRNLFLISFCLLLKTVFAQPPGTLDPSFGNNGIVLSPIGVSATEAKTILLQPDGKIILAGETMAVEGQPANIALARYNADGSPDTSFGSNGITLVPTPGFSNFIFASILLPNGKIILGGGAAPPGVGGVSRSILARFNNDGSLDTSFGVQGLVYTLITSGSDIYALTRQTDGKIVAAGTSNNLNGYPICTMIRYDSLGNLDSDFGTNGIVTTMVNPVFCQFTSIGLLPDGRIVAGGSTINGNYLNHISFLLVRYMHDGSLDPTFGDQGIDLSGTLGETSFSFGLNICTDGKIILAGRQADASGGFAAAKYNPDGGLDQTFGNQGSVTTSLGNPLQDLCRAITVQPDGKILLTGVSYPVSGSPLLGLIRYTANGILDSLFGTNGITTTDMGNDLNYGTGITLQPDGNILVSSSFSIDYNQNDFAIARFIGGDYPVGVPPGFQSENLKIFPNPVVDNLNIDNPSGATNGNLSIYNITGLEILNLPITGPKLSINVSFLQDGVYIIKYHSPKGVETGRFIKILR